MYIEVGKEITPLFVTVPFASVAENTKFKIPVELVIPLAVPLIKPLDDNDIPEGNVPDTNPYVGAVPESSVADNWYEYALPFPTPVIDPEVTQTGPLSGIVIEELFVVVPFASVAPNISPVTVVEVVGVPEIKPELDKVKPPGKVPLTNV